MYHHNNYPPNQSPQLATGGFLSPQQQLTNNMTPLNYSQAHHAQMNTMNHPHQMSYHHSPANQMQNLAAGMPPNSNLSNQMMPPSNYQPTHSSGKVMSPLSNQQQQQISDSIKQQQQMYMRPPLMQSSGKPISYQQQIPQNIYSQSMPPGHPSNAHHPQHLSMPPSGYPYHPPVSLHQSMLNNSSSADQSSAHYQIQSNPTANLNDHYAHMRPPMSGAANYSPYNYPAPNGSIMYNNSKYPPDNRLINSNLNTSASLPIDNNLSSSQNENKLSTDERSETPKISQQKHSKTISHSTTPNPLGSPGAASMSSFHDELENASSPGLPRTPASPAVNAKDSSSHSKGTKKGDTFVKLYELGKEPERKPFLDKLIALNEEKGNTNAQCPSVNKNLIDLFKLYQYVKEKGGFEEIVKKKKWKEVSNFIFNRPDSSAPLANTLKKHYIKHIVSYECKYDLGGIDSQQFVNRVDPVKEKKKSNKNAPSPSPVDSNSQSSYPQAATPVSSDGSNLSSLSSTNKSSQQSNGQQSTPAIPSTASTVSNEKFSSPIAAQSTNNLSSVSSLKQSQQHQINFNSNQKSPVMPNYGQQPNSQQMPFRPPSRNNQYSMPNDPNSAESSLNNSLNSSLSHNEQFPTNHQLNTSLPYPPPPPQQSHHLNSVASAEHYQNMSRTHSPLAQRLMQQKSPVPPNYPNQQSVYSNSPMTPNKNQQTPPEMQSNLNSPNFAKRPMMPQTPTNNQQMMYSSHQQSNMPPQYHSPYGHPFRPNVPPQSNMPPPYNYPIPDPNFPHADYSKMPNYQVPTIPTSYPSTQMQPPTGIPVQQQSTILPPHQQHHSNSPAQVRPQYLLNLLANNGSGSPNVQQQNLSGSTNQQLSLPQQQKIQQQNLPPSQQQLVPVSSIQQPATTNAVQSTYHHYGPAAQTIPSVQQTTTTTTTTTTTAENPFPPNSIEAVQPKFVKRKRITSKDVNQIEAWRLMMGLKSGLLAESTWALDVLSILIHDDNTYLYFGLQKLPGLLDILLEYYKHYLTEIFPDLFQNDGPLEECKSVKKMDNNLNSSVDKQFECETIRRMKKRFNSDLSDEETDQINNSEKNINQNGHFGEIKTNGEIKSNKKKKELNVNSELVDDLKEENQFKQFVLSPKNDYTFVTRTGKPVKINPDDENLFISDFDKSWDLDDRQFKIKNECKLYFSKGYGSITNYIQKHFEVGDSCLKFARNLDKMYEEYDEDRKSKMNTDVNKENLESNRSNYDDENEEDKSTEEDDQQANEYPRFRNNRRKFNLNYESEAYKRDQPPLCALNDYNDTISRRCICISTLIRNMSFVPGNEVEFSKYKDLLFILGKLILLHHQHLEKQIKTKTANLQQLEETLFNEIESTENTEQLNSLTKKSSSSSCETVDYLSIKDEWWWDTLHFIRENTLVTLANMSGKLDLSKYAECISLNIFDGLLHWTVCKSSDAQDHLPSTSLTHLSPRRLSLECLAKLSILEGNVDLILSTPPWERILELFRCLAEQLSRDQEQTLREFALVLVHNLVISDVSIARAVSVSSDCIGQLINFIEFAEQRAVEAINQQQGYHVLKENPECFGTTLDMIKRAATSLRCLARISENRPLFFNYQQRLIALLMSQVLHPTITNLIADILYECSLSESFTTSNLIKNSSLIDENSICNQ